MKLIDSKEPHGIMQLLTFKFGDGQYIPLWAERWLGQYPLSIQFPNHYMVASNKAANVWNQGNWFNGNLEGLIGWSINIESYEYFTKERDLMELLCDVKLVHNQRDIFV